MARSTKFTPDDVAANFWSVVRDADRDDQKLRALLSRMSRAEMIRFYRDYINAAGELREPPYAAPGSSSDAAEDIAWWVVAQGQDFYRQIYEHPEQTPRTLPRDRRGLGFMSQIGNVFYERFGEELTEVDLDEV